MATKRTTVGDLIQQLQKFPADLPVGIIGLCSEFYEIHPTDFSVHNAYLTNLDEHGHANAELTPVLTLAVPDLGEETASL